MNTDIRLKVTFLNHRKRKKLQRALGAAGVLAFVDLMLSAAINRPNGILAGYDTDDIAIDAQWEGNPKELVDTLVSIGLLDEVDGILAIHDWQDHNAYASDAETRSGEGRFGNLKKYYPHRAAELEAQGITTITASEYAVIKAEESGLRRGDTGGDSGASRDDAGAGRFPSPPSPAPYPDPEKKEENTYVVSDAPKKKTATRTRHEYSPAYEAFFAAYPARNGQKNGKHAGQKAFDKALHQKGITPDFLTDRIRELALQYGDYPPDIATWLNNRRWEDPVAEPANDFDRDLAAMRAAAKGMQ